MSVQMSDRLIKTKKGDKVLKKREYETVKKQISDYFSQRLDPKSKNPDGSSAAVFIRPLTVTGLALALGLSSREELFSFKDKKTKELIEKSLMKIEENAEEKLFTKEYYQGAKLFLEVNFKRWGKSEGEQWDPSEALKESGKELWAN